MRVDPSWTFIAVLVVLSFWGRTLTLHEGLNAALALALAVGAALCLFGSVLVHELAHAITARRRQIAVAGITLFLFGGVTESEPGERTAGDELVVAVVGPLSSFAVAAVLGMLSLIAGPSGGAVADTVGYLAWLNLVLAVFNLLPGFPLDGGRVLRASAWAITGDRARATRLAAAAGLGLGYALIALGLLAVAAGGFGGLWLAAIGWFLAGAARASAHREHVVEVLDHVRVDQIMSPGPVSMPASVTVRDAIDEWFLARDHGAFGVLDDLGEVVGLVTMRDVRRVPIADRETTTVGAIAAGLAGSGVGDRVGDGVGVGVVDAATPVTDVLDHLDRSAAGRVLVSGWDGRIVGIVTATDVTRAVHRREGLGLG